MQSHSTGKQIMNDKLLGMSKTWKDLLEQGRKITKKCQDSQSYDTNHRTSKHEAAVLIIILLHSSCCCKILSVLQTHPHADSLEAATPYHQMSLLQGPASRWGVSCRAVEALHNTSSYLFISQMINKCRVNITFANTVQRKLSTRENTRTPKKKQGQRKQENGTTTNFSLQVHNFYSISYSNNNYSIIK